MKHPDRREFIELSAAGLAAASVGFAPAVAAAAEPTMFKPEKGAKIQILRWSGFVKNDDLIWAAHTKKFTEATGVPVEIQSINWPDVSPKAALAAQVNSGPDIIMGFNDDPQLYPEKLVDVTDLCNYMGKKYGGWQDIGRTYCYGAAQQHWIAMPIGCPGNAMAYRKSWAEQAGFKEFPKDFDGFLKLARGMKKNGHPTGFALGHAVGDANSWTHWLLWGFGGKQANPDNSVAINSPQTVQALEYAKQLHETMIDGVGSWLDPSNNQAFLAGQIGLTLNGISIWAVAKDQFPAIFPDTANALAPVGPVKRNTMFNIFSSAYIFKYSKYPNAAKDYLRYMMELPNAEEWVVGMRGYVTPALNAYLKFPLWTSDPNITPFRDTIIGERFDGYNGKPGRAAAKAVDEFVVSDMFADVCINNMTPKDAIAKAEGRLVTIYKAG